MNVNKPNSIQVKIHPNTPKRATIIKTYRSQIVKPIQPFRQQTIKPATPLNRIQIARPTRIVAGQPVKSHRLANIADNRKPRQGKLRHEDPAPLYKEVVERLRNVGRERILIMVACGPSILEIPLERLKNHSKIDIMCINKPESRVWPSKYWAFCDQSQYSRNRDAWEHYTGTIINATSVRARNKRQVLIRTLNGAGFSRDLHKGYYIGRSSTYAALQVALWMNYSFVFIVGLDMCSVGGKLWFYGQNPDVSSDNRMKRFAREADSYTYAVGILTEEERKRIFMCSSYNIWPFVKSFSRLDHKACIPFILDHANSLI